MPPVAKQSLSILAFSLLFGTFSGAWAGGKVEDPFDSKFKRGAATSGMDEDPFDPKFKRDSKPTPKIVEVPGKGKDKVDVAKNGEDLETLTLAKVIQLKATADKASVRRGEIIKVTISGTPAEGHYTYPHTVRTKEMYPGQLTKLSYLPQEWLTPLYPVKESDPVPYKNTSLVHKKPFHWEQELFIKQDAPTGKQKIIVKVFLQVCKDSCIGPAYYPNLEIPLEIQGGDAVAPPDNLAKRSTKPEAPVVTATSFGNGSPEVAAGGKGDGTSTRPTTLMGLLIAAFVGGLLMVFTPCVFPMIPITVNFFIKQSEKEHHRPLFLASVYSGTIIVLLTLTVVAFGGLVVELAENPWFNLALGGVLIFFAFSLFGMYEIELPSFLARFTSARESKGGFAGAFFMALTFTITSFTCTGPFLGIMLAPFAEIKPPFMHRVLAALVYSATFAAPFFFLALFPTLLRKLPKSGGWMNSIKVTMGFVELGAALKFLANTDYALFPGQPRLFTYDAVLCSWIAISFAAGLYLLGLFRLPHDDPQEHIGVVRMVFATIFFGFTLYMLPLLFGGRPTGIVGEGLRAFLPPRLGEAQGGFAGGGKKSGEHLSWHQDYETAWKEAVKEDKLLLIDFTGVFCTNCRDNEENVFPRPEVVGEMKKYVRVQLYTDTVPDTRLSASEAKMAAQKHKNWRNNLVKDVTLPYYVIFRPDPNKPFDGDELLGEIIDTRKDLIRSPEDFVKFLSDPQVKRDLTGRGKKSGEHLSWHQDYETAWKEAVKEDKLLLLNFTAGWCTNAVDNEENVFPRLEVAGEMKKYVRVQLYTDTFLPDPRLTASEAKTAAQKHKIWRDNLVKDVTVPYYVIFRPDPNKPFDGDELLGEIIDTRNGLIRNTEDFVKFLREPKG